MKALSKELGKLCALCREISTMTEHDVFTEYSPHVNTFSVRVFENGWRENKERIWITDIGGNEVTFRNINAAKQKLQKYKKAPTETAISSVGTCGINQLQDTNYSSGCQ